MATINQMYGIGISGLTAQKALAAIASQNIANADTPGYVRQSLSLTSRRFGLPGVDVEGPRAIRNPFLSRQLVDTFGRLGYHEGQQAALMRIQGVVNDLDGSGIGPQLTSFQTALSTLSANPNSTPDRDAVLASAEQLAVSVNSARRQLLEGADATYDEAVSTVDEVNTMATEIAALNDQIKSLVGANKNANELISKRDYMISELGRLVDVETVAQQDGSVSVFVGAGRALVDGSGASELVVSNPGPAPDYTVDVTLKRSNGQVLELGAPVGGRVGGLVDAYQDTAAAAVTELDAFAQQITDSVNAAHGAPFFSFDGTTLSLDPAVDGNPAAINVDGTGQAAADMAALVNEGNPSLLDSWQAITRNISEPLSLAETGVSLEGAQATQLEMLLLSETAVSIDEELVALSQANAAFEASSEVIRVAEQLTSTVLNMVG